MGTRTLRVWARAALALSAALIVGTVAITPAVADDQQPDSSVGLGVWVPVLQTPPKATASSATRAPTSGAPDAATGSSVVTEAQNKPAAGEMVIAGGLYFGDLRASSRPTLNPFEGRTELWLTLRNLSTDTIEATADFSLATFYGERIDGTRVDVSALKPGETRVVGTTLQGSGQWPAVIGRVTLNPPELISGQKTAAVSRATVVYVFPWLLMIGVVLAALALVLLRLSRSAFAAPTLPAASAA